MSQVLALLPVPAHARPAPAKPVRPAKTADNGGVAALGALALIFGLAALAGKKGGGK
jgi:hypothetical protein